LGTPLQRFKPLSSHTQKDLVCWAVSDGKAGMENQCVGLAQALGITPIIKRIALRQPWDTLTPFLRLGLSQAFSAKSSPLTPPWPDLLITTGRRSLAASLYVKKASKGHTKTVQIQDPVISPRHFDLVIVPQHDSLRGDNVLVTQGSIHNITAEKLATAAAAWQPRVAHLPPPYIAVLIGGANAVYTFDATAMSRVSEQLVAMIKKTGGSLLVTPSRRTGVENQKILREKLSAVNSFVWDEQGDNPYHGFLGLASHIIVTADSVNMVCEAASTGKPVQVIALEGGSKKFLSFHASMQEKGIIRPFEGTLEQWDFTPLDDVQRAVTAVQKIMA
jgi:mitochondrial fission protein ELM1